jgi:D-alanine transaminase
MPRYAFVNGRYIRHGVASVHIEDRGYQFADGVYEVIACIHGMLADEQGHLDRLERSLAELQIDMPVTRDSLRFIMRELLRRNKLRNANVYIQVTRGVAKRDFSFPDRAETPPALVLTTRPYNFDGNLKVKNGSSVITVPDMRWKRRDIKSIGLLPQVLAKQKATEAGAYEAWLVDEEGCVTEGASSNAWIVTKDRKVVTRNVTTSILRGVTRTALENILRDLNLQLEERAFTVEEALNAAEALNTSAVALIVGVVTIDGKKIGDGTPGPVARALYEAYRAYVQKGSSAQVHWESGLSADEEAKIHDAA